MRLDLYVKAGTVQTRNAATEFSDRGWAYDKNQSLQGWEGETKTVKMTVKKLYHLKPAVIVHAIGSTE